MEEILKPKQKRNILEVIETIFISIAFCLVIYLTIAVPNKVEGSSMYPTFVQSDLVITNKTIQYLGNTDFGKSRNYDYQRGDVVILNKNNTDLIKRIIAVGGETVEIKNNKVYINDKLLEEKYLSSVVRTKLPSSQYASFKQEEKVKVPEGSYMVLGDNREESKDSRYKDVGFIERNKIKGKVVFRYWPLSEFGIIRKGYFELIETN